MTPWKGLVGLLDSRDHWSQNVRYSLRYRLYVLRLNLKLHAVIASHLSWFFFSHVQADGLVIIFYLVAFVGFASHAVHLDSFRLHQVSYG